MHGAVSVQDFFRLANERAMFDGEAAEKHCKMLVELVVPFKNVDAVAALTRAVDEGFDVNVAGAVKQILKTSLLDVCGFNILVNIRVMLPVILEIPTHFSHIVS